MGCISFTVGRVLGFRAEGSWHFALGLAPGSIMQLLEAA